MLTPVDDGPAIVACNTCRHSRDAREDDTGQRADARLIAALRAVQGRDERYACTEFCTVHLRAPDKVGYVLGRFSPDEEAATAILDYALHYAESEHGRVPFKQWPEGVKGHFITRTPPPGFVAR